MLLTVHATNFSVNFNSYYERKGRGTGLIKGAHRQLDRDNTNNNDKDDNNKL